MTGQDQHLEVRKHFATPWLVDEFTLTKDALTANVAKADAIFELFRVGTNHFTFPLGMIGSIATKTRFRLLRLVLAVFGIWFGSLTLGALASGSAELGILSVVFVIFLPAGIWLLLQVFTAQLVIRDAAGKKERIDVDFFERKSVRSFADAVTRAAAETRPDAVR